MLKAKYMKQLILGAFLVLSFSTNITVFAKEAKTSSHVKPADDYKALNQKLGEILKKGGVPQSEVGIWIGVQGEQGAATIFSHNEDHSMVPASLSKLFTLGAALHILGPSFKFQTQLLSRGSIQEQTLKGDLYLKGGGDPSFVNEDMWALVNDFTRNQITEIDGDLIVDDSRFDKIRFDEDRESTRVDRAYDAPVGAMSMNWNSVNVYVRPGKKVGDPCLVVADPVNMYLKVDNQTSTVGDSKAKTIAVERVSKPDFKGDIIRVTGKLPLNHDEVVIYKSITQPEMWSAYNLIEFLKQRGIKVTGQIKTGITPKEAKVLSNRDSKALGLIVADMAKFSNNYVAEMLAKNLAAESDESPATMKTGLAQINKFMNEIGLNGKDIKFVNASGFTRGNKISPSELGHYLEIIQSDFSIFPEYLSALPIAGRDGTLKKRMKDMGHIGWVRAKTGLLTGTVGLSGFVGMNHGQSAVFAFIYNGGGGVEDKARNLFDRLAEELSK